MSEIGRALVKYCDEFLHEKKQHMASRHEVFETEQRISYNGGPLVKAMCILKSYAALGTEDQTKYVWEMHAIKRGDKPVEFSVKGPYEDCDDEYWLDMYKHDKEVGNGLITHDYMHYTVSKDSRNPGQGDGHGGWLFRIELIGLTATKLARYKAMGLKIEYNSVEGDHLGEKSGYVLYTRNLWQQGRIPKKHREHFKPNCKIL